MAEERSIEDVARDLSLMAREDATKLGEQFSGGLPSGMEKMLEKEKVRLAEVVSRIEEKEKKKRKRMDR